MDASADVPKHLQLRLDAFLSENCKHAPVVRSGVVCRTCALLFTFQEVTYWQDRFAQAETKTSDALLSMHQGMKATEHVLLKNHFTPPKT